MAEITINHHIDDTNINNMIVNSDFNANKCWARLNGSRFFNFCPENEKPNTCDITPPFFCYWTRYSNG